MSEQQEQNKLDSKMREAMKELQTLLDKYDVDIAFKEERLNGNQVMGAIVLIPRPTRLAMPTAVMKNAPTGRRSQ